MLVEEMLVHIGNNLELLLSVGFLMGLLHAFEPDHMVAMLTQVQSNRKKNTTTGVRLAAMRYSLLGALWGFGHTSIILLVSFVVFVFALNIPATVFDGFEFAVGIMLVILGISMYSKKKVFGMKHLHPHTHENGIIHTHPHEHDRSHAHTHKSYLIGCIHGLAGSGGLIAVSMMALNDISGMLSFVLIFGIGSIIGMMVVSGALSVPFFLSNKFARLRKCLQVLAGTITAIIGLEIIYGIVTSEKLFVFM